MTARWQLSKPSFHRDFARNRGPISSWAKEFESSRTCCKVWREFWFTSKEIIASSYRFRSFAVPLLWRLTGRALSRSARLASKCATRLPLIRCCNECLLRLSFDCGHIEWSWDTVTKMGNGHLKISFGEAIPSQGNSRKVFSRIDPVLARRAEILREDTLHAMLMLERRRAERSRKPFVLMLLDSHAVPKNGNGAAFLEQLTSVVCDATRETDLIGWYEEGAILAVIFTEISLDGKNPITEILHSKVVAALRESLDRRLALKLVV